eukprot:Skav224572  [mRNA]  locus=scaffold246:22249:40689:+ [translate_table: standard]
MQVWQTVSSVRQRARNAERITKKLQEEVHQRFVKRTYEEMGAFDEHARTLKDRSTGCELCQEKAAREEAEEEAELVRLSEGWSRARAVQLESSWATWDAGKAEGSAPALLTRVAERRSGQLAATLAENSSETSSIKRLGLINGQWDTAEGSEMGPAGTCISSAEEFKQGPYGSTLQDPILMPPMHWVKSSQHTSPPERYMNDAADLRPRTAEGRDRPLLLGRCGRMGAMVGQFDGRFANPLQKNSGWPNEEMINEVNEIGAESAQHTEKVPRLAWDMQGSFSGLTSLAKHIFLSLHSVMRKRRANLKHLFKYVNHGIPGILEPHEFLEGLQRLGIVEKGQCSPQEMADLMHDLDPNFDGRVALSEVNRCVQATRAICAAAAWSKSFQEPPQPTGGAKEGSLAPATAGEDELLVERSPKPHATVPFQVEKVTVERQPKSLWDFECTFEEPRVQRVPKPP